MGNTLPISSPPRPSPSRAVIFMEPQCIGSYLSEPWRKPVGQLQVIGTTDELPAPLDGLVPLDEYRSKMDALKERAAQYRGGMIHILVAMFQACLFAVLMIGFFLSKYMLNEGRTFFNPITLVVLGTLEIGVLSQTGRFFQREETALKKDMLDLFRPWIQEYGVITKVRKSRGQITVGEGEEKKKSSTYYCLILEKRGPDDDIDTVSLSSSDVWSTFTDAESDIESQA